MRLVELAVVLAFVVVIGLMLRRLVGNGRAEAEWEPFHRFDGGCRRVYVRRGDELEPVGDVLTTAPDYDERFMRLMETARERAAVLNSER
jgi:hypothetical protein